MRVRGNDEGSVLCVVELRVRGALPQCSIETPGFVIRVKPGGRQVAGYPWSAMFCSSLFSSSSACPTATSPFREALNYRAISSDMSE
jgi:hypothetical protein